MRIFLAFILGFVLAGVASAKPVDSDPVTLIAAIYKTYETDQAGLPHVFSKRLRCEGNAGRRSRQNRLGRQAERYAVRPRAGRWTLAHRRHREDAEATLEYVKDPHRRAECLPRRRAGEEMSTATALASGRPCASDRR